LSPADAVDQPTADGRRIYSVLRAHIGSTREARHAGTQQAISVTDDRSTGIAAR
jgi:hypothetical protein